MNNDSKTCSPDNVAAMETLVWHSLRVTLRSARSIGGQTSVLKILQATLKHIPTGNDSDPERPAIKRAFHVPEVYGHSLKYRARATFPLEILFFSADGHDVTNWLQAFSTYLATSPRANFELIDVKGVTHHNGLDLIHPAFTDSTQAELEVLTP